MADYYPLIARAIAGLDPNAPGEARRALYARARTALIQQLRGVQPPLSESEITRERLSLEEAVRKVESEAAQRAREASRPGGAAAVRGSRANARPPEPGPADTAARPRPPAEPRPPRNLRPDAPPSAPPRPQNPPVPPETQAPPARPGPPRRGPEGAPPPVPPAAPGVRGFRDITADADDLGRAAAQASRNARKTYANVPSPSPEFDRLEPSLENRGGDPEAPYSYDESIEEAERYTPQPPQGPPPQRSRAGNGEREPKKPPRVGSMFPFKTAIVIGILLILVGTGILFRQQAMTLVSSLLKSSAPVEAPKDAASTPASKKITDRVGQPSSSGETVAPVAQRVVLYDEDPSDPKGKQYVGSVVWRTEQVKGSGNQKPDIAVRADIDIPDRKFKMTMSFRRNTDSSLPASHTAELTFILPQDFANGGVGNVPGILMKSNEQARGTPLAGLAVKVTDGFFLVGLSNVDADRSRNLQLLKERSWFDVPLVYTNQRRAIIAIEKGAPGERAFNEAFAAWGE
ncbi:hypothetical protein ACVIHH_005224 [Bradyrhizobium sp. USDA 4518]|uniref:hypothetical protein n=1 Tax=Bradyrhizobium sp. USDA 4541 TaxID=2817704 RepID=UPI0020A4CBD5|nr:hypothetical protein [Bradyrhizobium sp. USDA 4541]MCP1848812.1 hypothetical protein [Bradyrhizobium sp. USDA 4541]